MNASEERRRILDMLAAGQISADQAAELLEAIGPSGRSEAPAAKAKGTARLLRISIDATKPDGSKEATVRVNVPLGLAKFAGRFLPPDARTQLEGQGIDLATLLDSLDTDVPGGRLVDFDAVDEDKGTTAKIVIEVV
ncbi:MAG TPA: hypothetical protein VKA00_09150 [Trueperaceae bacterium]|nr:hypothetical protein [Trueperaceae bacterium]